jgi:hypothetical protein
MAPSWNLDDLEIVGYANVLKETMLPSVVPPVFRLKADSQRAFLPPYSFNTGYLCDATEVPQSELEELRDSLEITLFDAPFHAHRDFELWVDQSYQRYYEPRADAERTLRRIADEEIKNAEDALRSGDLPRAERLSGVAISADYKRVEPLAIKAAIRRKQADTGREHLMATLAAPFLGERRFNRMVADYCALMDQQESEVPVCERKGAMQEVAHFRAAA